MTTTEIILRSAAGLVLVLANAFFVATEFALTRARQLPREAFQDTAALRLAWSMTERLEIYLTGCQLGITASSILLGVIAEPAVTRLLQPLFGLMGLGGASTHLVSIVVAVVLINLVHKIYGEQAPTYWGVERPQMVSRLLAPGLYWWVRIMHPVILFGDGLAKASLRLFGIEVTRSWLAEDAEEAADEEIATREELRHVLRDVLTRGGIPGEEREEVLKTLDIGRIPVERVMVPRERMAALSLARSPDENYEVIAESQVARFPLLDEREAEFVGVVYLTSLFRHLDDVCSRTIDLTQVAEPPVRVPADRAISQVIDTLQHERQELALVERDGTVVGLVTITDTFEAIAGQLEDPFD